ncbi:MAG: sugar transferase [Sulfurimonas sp.]|jgi:undecaprenyl-phosphate galactose phosphotransferase
MKKNSFNIATYLLALILIAVDYFVLLLAVNITIYLRSDFFTKLPKFNAANHEYSWMILIILFLFIYEKIYTKRYDYWSDTYKILKALLYSFFTIFSFITLSKASDDYSRLFIILFFALAFILIPLTKRVTKNLLFRVDFFKLKVKILADDEKNEILKKEIDKNWYLGYKMSDTNFDMVLISSKEYDATELQKIINKYIHRTKDIYIIPYLENIDFSHAEMISYSNIRLSSFHIENRLLNYKNIVLKYMFERFLSLLILPFVLIAHLIISILIKVDSKGDILFKQKRLGRNSKLFECYKYRSMYENADIMLQEYLQYNPKEIENYKIFHKYENDPRITKIGKFLRATSLDELPQFYNIFKGEMNLIGPRPYMCEESPKIGKLNQELILKVAPGITGLWQVSGRNELTFEQRVDLDVWYIRNWSLWMDFVIFLKTIKVVLSKVGAR